MIIRIFTEGQYELPETALAELDELDAEAEAAVNDQDEARFHERYQRLLDHIRTHGRPLAVDDLRPSELILPPPDISLTSAAREFHGHGLIVAADERVPS